ncbi:DMT family transporter [Roseivivax isoporae]|uniref:Multidrug transporter n=1 Tax=Roseivivax isoporae LMG 25204 TaxID=1449351 RepID=X7FEK6_9RHOB|nr:SMR family transporter [Roseivivax isoporae]ETX30491.1 multidrug transporter [Roseivivax isoporae LMG 25204]
MPPFATYAFLCVAIMAEVVATTALARSENFTRLGPTIITVVGYALAFYCLSYPIRVLPTGIVYAIWSGLGIVLITAVAWLWAGEKLDVPAMIGLALIVSGVVVLNVFSKSISH